MVSDDVVRPKAFIRTASSAVAMSNKMPPGIQNKLDPFSIAITYRSNEKEISHGRVSWQTPWSCIAKGPLASSVG